MSLNDVLQRTRQRDQGKQSNKESSVAPPEHGRRWLLLTAAHLSVNTAVHLASGGAGWPRSVCLHAWRSALPEPGLASHTVLSRAETDCAAALMSLFHTGRRAKLFIFCSPPSGLDKMAAPALTPAPVFVMGFLMWCGDGTGPRGPLHLQPHRTNNEDITHRHVRPCHRETSATSVEHL